MDADCNFKPCFCCIFQIRLFSNTNSKHLTINESNNTCTKPLHTQKKRNIVKYLGLFVVFSGFTFLSQKLLSLHRFGFIFTFYLVNFVSSLVVACSIRRCEYNRIFDLFTLIIVQIEIETSLCAIDGRRFFDKKNSLSRSGDLKPYLIWQIVLIQIGQFVQCAKQTRAIC